LKASQGAQSANDGEEDTSSTLFLCYAHLAQKQDDTWILDTRCANHMTDKGDFFCTMDDSYKSQITLGDDKAIQVEGMGAILEVSTNEGNKKVNDVYFISKLKHNLLSVGKMMEKNYKIVFEDKKYIIYDKNEGHKHVTSISMTKNRLFPLKFG